MALPYNNLGHLRSKGLYKYTFTFYFFIDLTNINTRNLVFFFACRFRTLNYYFFLD